MELKFKTEKYGEIVYNESAWGTQRLTIGGIECKKIARRKFAYKTEELEQEFLIQGSFLFGVKISANGQVVCSQAGPKWYEILLAVLPFIFVLTWSNIPKLAWIMPLVGGAVGGALGGIMMVLSLVCMRLVDKPIYKVLLGIIFFCATIGITYAFGLIFVMALA